MSAGTTELVQTSRDVLDHYNRILDPLCSYEERIQHQKIFDEFRDCNPLCIECGLLLINESNLVAVKLGLDLLEYFIRREFRWNSLNQQERYQLSCQLIGYSKTVGNNGGSVPVFVKESIAKCVCEVVKKAWPQYWENFIPELLAIGDQPTHLELILLVYRRLTEDVVMGFDRQLSGKRKSQLMSEMKTESFLLPLFKLVINVLQNTSMISLLEVAVTSLSSIAEWVDIQYLTVDQGRLLGLLFDIVSNHQLTDSLRTMACDCLIDVVSRKGELKTSADHRKVFLVFLSKEVLEWIHRVVIGHHQSSGNADEDQYLLVKRLCQLMVQIGTCQIIPLVSAEAMPVPDTLPDYLSLLMAFTQHSSQLVCDNTIELWSALINNHTIRTDQVISILPQLMQILRTKQFKVGDPELSNHPSCLYSCFDFDGTLEHSIFFSKFKSRVNSAIIMSVSLVPLQASEQARALVQELVQKPQLNESSSSKTSPVYLEWDAATSYIECWVSGLKANDLLKDVASYGVAILESLLLFTPTDATLVACHLKMLEGGLQNFIVYNEQVLVQKYMEKILMYAVYPSIDTDKLVLTREQRQTRMASLRCLTALVKACTAILVPATDQLLEFYLKLIASDCLLYSEKALFIETFVALSHYKPVDEQTAIITKLVDEVVSLIQSELKQVAFSLPHLIQYLGFNKAITDDVFTSNGDCSSAHHNRAKLCYCVHVIMSVLQKCTLRERRKSGNDSGYMDNIAPLMVPLLLEFLLPLLKTYHLLWSEESRPLLSTSFQALHSLCLHEKEMIMGTMGTTSPNQDDMNRVLSQVILSYDHCVMAVGFACPSFGLATLNEAGFVETIVQCVFSHLSQTKQLRLKPIIRHMMIPIVIMCPCENWQTTLLPLLAHFCHVTFNCLQTNWSSIMKKHYSSHDPSLPVTNAAPFVDNDNSDEQTLSDEVLYQQFTMYLTRQYVQLLETICIKKLDASSSNERAGDTVASGGTGFNNIAATMETEGSSGTSSRGQQQQLSDLAIFLLKSEIHQLILLSMVGPIAWTDGYTARKCVSITTAMFEKIPIVEFGEQVAYQVMDQILMALQIHGEDDSVMLQLLMLGLLIYESTIECFPSIAQRISSLPGCTPDHVQKFNHRLISNGNDPSCKTGKGSKWKRDEFKRLLSGIIGKPVGQLHKNSPVYLDLPSLVVKKTHRFKEKVKSDQLDDVKAEDLTSLFGE